MTEPPEALTSTEREEPVPVSDEPTPSTPRRRRRVGWIVAVTLLGLALIAAGGALAFTLIKLSEAQQLIDHQRELIDEKETFASAAQELMSTAAQFDGVPYDSLVKASRYAGLIERAWQSRWDAGKVAEVTASIRRATGELTDLLTAAENEASSNATGTIFESLTDQLGAGFVKTSLDTADTACASDVWGCVAGEEPFTIHYDAADTGGQPYMNDWLRTGLAYHEYAHVLQFANPGPTTVAEKAFGGDWETMADCYALTVLPGWTLDHTIWVSDYEYWEVSVGYGYTCDESQRQVIRDWVDDLGYTHEPISQ